jgi:C4-dicarboxylate transporter DctM subunit
MIEVWLSVILVMALFILLGSGVWVAISLTGAGVLGLLFFSNAPAGTVLASTLWGGADSWELAALPMFIWMGEILFRSRLPEDMFAGLAPWMTKLPGRLMHVNIVGCGIFAAVSGSSAATCATIGKIAIPELGKRDYDERLIIGTLAGSGTLGLLIPPSIILIVYGVAIEESIARLFIAGVLPGLMLISMFMGYVMLWSLFNPERVPEADFQMTFREKVYQSRRLIPVVLLIMFVIGSIYAGIASPTAAAAVGVLVSLILARVSGNLSFAIFREGLMAAMRTSCMIAFILSGAAFLTVAMGFAGIPAHLAAWIGTLNLSPYSLIFALTIFFVIMGCFLDGISIVVLTTAIILPMVEQAGIDRIWFGIYIVLVVEMSQITPPVGFNLFVLQGLTGRNVLEIARYAFPFFLILVLAVVLLVIFPEIATWLPTKMSSTPAG